MTETVGIVQRKVSTSPWDNSTPTLRLSVGMRHKIRHREFANVLGFIPDLYMQIGANAGSRLVGWIISKIKYSISHSCFEYVQTLGLFVFFFLFVMMSS